MRLLPLLPLALIACADAPDDTGDALRPATFNVRMTNVSAAGSATNSAGPLDPTFAPGVIILHDDRFSLFTAGAPMTHASLEALVEDGNNAPLLAEVAGLEGVVDARSFAALDEDYNAAPMHPGESALLTLEDVEPGLRLTVAAMYGHSNDVFVATAPEGAALFDASGALYRELGPELSFWDGGTEVNEEPGLGADQPGRQAASDTGADEGGAVVAIAGTDAAGWAYPAAGTWVSVDVYGPVEGQ